MLMFKTDIKNYYNNNNIMCVRPNLIPTLLVESFLYLCKQIIYIFGSKPKSTTSDQKSFQDLECNLSITLVLF